MPTQEVDRAIDLIALLRAAPHASAVLLDGRGAASWGDGRARISAAPRARLEVFASGWGRCQDEHHTRWQWGSPLAQWHDFLRATSARTHSGDGESSGWLTMLAYDLKHWIERLPRRHAWPETPVLYCAYYDWCGWRDYQSGRTWLSGASRDALARAQRWLAAARGSCPSARPPQPPARRASPSVWPKDEYRTAVARALRYIAAGDIYQVNLARRFQWLAPTLSAVDLYDRLCNRFPMPFNAYVDGGAWTVVSNSPECFLVVEGDRVRTFPIKGTCRRRAPGTTDEAPAALARDPKERAEHVMIVDLERNDLGRVCAPGSVDVVELGAVRSYPFLHHMVSEVRGRLCPQTSLAAVIGATFPGGSVTGAPKVRALEIIEELEPQPRGWYTGAIGWTSAGGRSCFSLAIRTATLVRGALTYHAGGGIVADSDPDREYEETLLKSEALLQALAAPGRLIANRPAA